MRVLGSHRLHCMALVAGASQARNCHMPHMPLAGGYWASTPPAAALAGAAPLKMKFFLGSLGLRRRLRLRLPPLLDVKMSLLVRSKPPWRLEQNRHFSQPRSSGHRRVEGQASPSSSTPLSGSVHQAIPRSISKLFQARPLLPSRRPEQFERTPQPSQLQIYQMNAFSLLRFVAHNGIVYAP